jgi:ATPase subunit of ABC transporter with duplicated ATPase domains
MQERNVLKKGSWCLPRTEEIGYIDQHYGNLDPEKTPEEVIYQQNKTLGRNDIRKHLNSFLFRKNEEVCTKVKYLSGGEKARLSLAKVAANPPKLLILDEITNNVDIETKQYICEVLVQYPGAFVVISHEVDFLKNLPLTGRYQIEKGVFHPETQYLSER